METFKGYLRQNLQGDKPMKFNKKPYFYFIIITILFLVGRNKLLPNQFKKENSNEMKVSTKSSKLNIATWIDEKAPMEEILQKFKDRFPNVEVECSYIPSTEYSTSLMSRLTENTEFDLIALQTPDQYAQLVSSNRLEALNNYVSKDTFNMTVYGSIMNELTFSGKYYGLPYRNTVFLLYYNKTMFDKANLPYPTANMTWDEFRIVAKQLTVGSDDNKLWGTFIQSYPQLWTISAIQNGKSFLDDDLTPFIDALQFTINLQNDGSALTATDIKAMGLQQGGSLAIFGGNKAAMMPMGEWAAWQISALKNRENFDWNVAPMPYPKGGNSNVTLGSPVIMSINSSSKNKETAWEFLKLYCGEDGAEIYAKNGSIPGAITPETRKIYINENRIGSKNMGAFLDAQIEPFNTIFPKSKQLSDIVEEEFKLALDGKKTPEQAVKDLEKRRKILLGK